MKCCTTNENIYDLWINGSRKGQIDEQMDCGWMWENTHLLTLNVEKPNNCGSLWNVCESWWMKWCEIEWNVVYGSEEFCILFHFEQKPNVKELPKKDPKITLGTKINKR
jgi:hypothetical protein